MVEEQLVDQEAAKDVIDPQFDWSGFDWSGFDRMEFDWSGFDQMKFDRSFTFPTG